jgi:1-aminocyclopropane-1-carboxylate deaminase/D-cysteine desulfhydrase-like pyridoxal-dependent ACC family enzyme
MQEKMDKWLLEYPLEDYQRHSRIHPLPSFYSEHAKVFVKREDELGSLSIGCKMRKYLSLIPFLIAGKREVAIVGSAFSNNILGLCLLLKEKHVPFTLFLNRTTHTPVQGNFFFTLLTLKPHQIIWIEPGTDIQELQSQYERILQKSFIWVPMGSVCKEALPGSLTLPLDILKNQQDKSLSFKNIFIDAGTGFNAAALLLGLGYLDIKAKVYIVQVAGSDLDFPNMLGKCALFFKELYLENPSPAPFELLRPHKARSFGSVSTEHIEFIKEMAESEGILLDPIYNAKLFATAKAIILEKQLSGDTLIIHSGGTLSLSGFVSYFDMLNEIVMDTKSS